MKAGTSTVRMHIYMQVCSNFHEHTIPTHVLYLIIFMLLYYVIVNVSHTLAKWEQIFQCFSSMQLPSSGNNDKESTNEDGGDSE